MGDTAAADKRLGRYQLIKHLASGGMADVFIANATGIEGFERYVVIKRIKAEQSKNAAFVKMFLDEARLAASLHHQHIVQVHDIGQDDGEYFFAMEYIHGEDLRGLLMKVSEKKKQIPIEHVVTIMLAATAALHYAHEHRAPDRTPLNLVHRDVSPSNILVGYDGSVKVVDFGIAKAALRTDQTKSGVLKGKVAYMSPEQCRGKTLDRRSDIHALGIVLYELLTARRLFKGESDFMTMSAIVASRIPSPTQRRPDVPPELEEIVLKALSKQPDERYQTADEMRRALELFAAKAGLRTSTSGLGDYMVNTFGQRAEPWLVPGRDDDTESGELTVDFDGSASGVAAVPTDPFDEDFDRSGGIAASPIARARTKAKSTSPPVTLTSALDELENHADKSGTPLAWQATHPSAPRRRWLAGVIVGLAVLAIGAFSIMRFTGGDDAEAQSTSRTEAAAPAAKPAPTAVVPDPAPTEAAATSDVKPAVAETPGTPAAGSAGPAAPQVATTPVVKKPVVKRAIARPVVKKQTKSSGDPNWDPNSLLPE